MKRIVITNIVILIDICCKANGELAKPALFFLNSFKCNNNRTFKIAINVNGMNEYKKECTLKIEFKIINNG